MKQTLLIYLLYYLERGESETVWKMKNSRTNLGKVITTVDNALGELYERLFQKKYEKLKNSLDIIILGLFLTSSTNSQLKTLECTVLHR